jgi:predicted nucleotidyltransferase
VYVTRDILRFQEVLAVGGRLQIFSLLHNLSFPVDPPVPPQPQITPDPQFIKLVDVLCTIQAKTGQFLQIPVEIPTDQDIQIILDLLTIIEHGWIVTNFKELEIELENMGLEALLDIHRQDDPIQLSAIDENSYIELWGQKIQLGHKVRYLSGRIDMPLVELSETISTLGAEEYLPLRFSDVQIVEIFPDWFIREAQRLSQLLAEKFEVEAVYLFGSLVWSGIHTPETDIDLAVSGLPGEQYLEAVSYLERESKFPIDLVELNKVPEHLRQRILTEGKLLYERESVAAFG